MVKNTKRLIKNAGFVLWGPETWGPGEGEIDWSCDYNEELEKYTKLLIRKCIKIDRENPDAAPGEAIAEYFAIKK